MLELSIFSELSFINTFSLPSCMDLDERRRFVLEGVGEDGRKVLTAAGIDVAGAVTKILAEQDATQDRLRQATAAPSVENQLTSELAYRSADLDDVFGLEYVRRMNLLGLPEALYVSCIIKKESLRTLAGGKNGRVLGLEGISFTSLQLQNNCRQQTL